MERSKDLARALRQVARPSRVRAELPAAGPVLDPARVPPRALQKSDDDVLGPSLGEPGAQCGDVAAAMVASLEQAQTSHWLDLMTSELAPAQVEVLRLLVMTLKERA